MFLLSSQLAHYPRLSVKKRFYSVFMRLIGLYFPSFGLKHGNIIWTHILIWGRKAAKQMLVKLHEFVSSKNSLRIKAGSAFGICGKFALVLLSAVSRGPTFGVANVKTKE